MSYCKGVSEYPLIYLPQGVEIVGILKGTPLESYSIIRIDQDNTEGFQEDRLRNFDVFAKRDMPVFSWQSWHQPVKTWCYFQDFEFGVVFHVRENLIHRPKKPGFIYLIHADGSNRYKIGLSNNPGRRLLELKGQQPQQSPFDLKLVAVSNLVPDMASAETQWHEVLQEFRVRGEWFELEKGLADEVSRHIFGLRWDNLKIPSFAELTSRINTDSTKPCCISPVSPLAVISEAIENLEVFLSKNLMLERLPANSSS